MACPVLEFDPQKKQIKEKEKLQFGSHSIWLESQRYFSLWTVLKQKFIGIRKNKRIRNLVSEEIENNWSILKQNIRQKDIWEKIPILDYFELRIVTRSLSGYLEQGQSWTILCWGTPPIGKSMITRVCKYYMNN